MDDFDPKAFLREEPFDPKAFLSGESPTATKQTPRLSAALGGFYQGLRSIPSSIAETPRLIGESMRGPGQLPPMWTDDTPVLGTLSKAAKAIIEAPESLEKALRKRRVLPSPDLTPEEQKAQEERPGFFAGGQIAGAMAPA